MTYAGVGARKTPSVVLEKMREIGFELGITQHGDKAWTLYTGGAAGADQAFCEGAVAAAGKIKVFAPAWYAVHGCLPDVNRVTDIPPGAYSIARRYHPAWDKLGRGARALMARNVMVVLGESFVEPVRFVVAWTPGGNDVGGTGHTLRVARDFGVPIFNLYESTVGDVLRYADEVMRSA